jgi:hypothetical protein
MSKRGERQAFKTYAKIHGGWRGESKRHSLSKMGIKTSIPLDSPKMREINTGIHFNKIMRDFISLGDANMKWNNEKRLIKDIAEREKWLSNLEIPQQWKSAILDETDHLKKYIINNDWANRQDAVHRLQHIESDPEYYCNSYSLEEKSKYNQPGMVKYELK